MSLAHLYQGSDIVKIMLGCWRRVQAFCVQRTPVAHSRSAPSHGSWQHLITTHGGIIHDRERVTRVVPGATVHVHTTSGRYSAPRLVLCPGAWLVPVVRDLGLNVRLATTCAHVRLMRPSWRSACATGLQTRASTMPVCQSARALTAERFPVFMDYASQPMVYGFPIFE